MDLGSIPCQKNPYLLLKLAGEVSFIPTDLKKKSFGLFLFFFGCCESVKSIARALRPLQEC